MKIGVIGGSGFYQFSQSEKGETLSTPFGSPSSPIYSDTVGSNSIYFLARHGQGHKISPTEINYRANIFALKKLGCERVLSISAVGSMKKEIAPGDLVLPDQYIDRTKGVRPFSFFGNGVVAHAHFAEPCCHQTREELYSLARDLKLKIHKGGTYICIEGPQFSTKAESLWYRSLDSHLSVIGMTAMPEARLAREAGLCYQTVSMATDYDCWNEEASTVTVEQVMRVMKENSIKAKNLLQKFLEQKLTPCQICPQMMKNAVVTPKEMWPNSVRTVLETLLG